MAHHKTKTHRLFGNHVRIQDARTVWAHLSGHPNDSLRSIAAQVGLSFSRVGACVRYLVAAGYVEHLPRSARARRVIIPLVTLGDGARIVKQSPPKL